MCDHRYRPQDVRPERSDGAKLLCGTTQPHLRVVGYAEGRWNMDCNDCWRDTSPRSADDNGSSKSTWSAMRMTS